MMPAASVQNVGRISVRFNIELWTEHVMDDSLSCVTEDVVTYVAIDENRKPRPVNRLDSGLARLGKRRGAPTKAPERRLAESGDVA